VSFALQARRYYSLTKPGVLYGNALSAAAGFLLASGRDIRWALFLYTLIGTTLVIASACVINNYLDQDIDSKMARTKQRALVAGTVSGRGAVLFGMALGVIGLTILIAGTNPLVVAIGIAGFIDYVVLYGMLSKRRSIYGTLVGAVSGAAPIFAGYVAARGAIDAGAILVFLILFLWQIPEFYSIAIYRRDEYRAAGVPVVTVVKDVRYATRHIVWFTAGFVIAALLLGVIGTTGLTYSVIMALLGGYWLWLGLDGLKAKDGVAWARRMFKFSLIILLAFSFLISIDAWLP
jgi:protoheme IX farnesyltransferase